MELKQDTFKYVYNPLHHKIKTHGSPNLSNLLEYK
jgi:hypothetical protein